MSVAAFNLVLLPALVLAASLWLRSRRIAAGIFATVMLAGYLMLPPVGFAALGTILLMILLSAPLFVTIGLLSVVCFYFGAEEYGQFSDYQLIIEKIFTLTDKNVLLAIPFFVVAGSLMTAGGIARRVIAFADALVGWLPGGLAAATVFSCAFFAAISGSSPVTVIAIGSIMMPALVKRGYREDFSLGLVTSAGSLGILIPPSIPMIIYAIVVTGPMSVNVADLFIAGIIPGVVVAGVLIGYSIYVGASQPDFAWSELRPPSLKRIALRFKEGFWALLLPVIILGGIYPIFGPRGFFTPTEAAAVSAVYALLVELLIHRELEVAALPKLLVESTVMMGSLLIIMILSFSLNHYFVDQAIPDAAVEWIGGMDLGRVGFLLVLNLFLLLVGCLMDIISAVLVVAPLIAPIAASFGIAPLHLAIIFVVNLEIGYLTPPIGMNLFVSATLFDKPIGFVTRAVVPFTLLMLAGLAAITWFEPISLGLGRALADRPAEQQGEAPPPGSETPDGDEDGDEDEDGDDSSRILSIEELMQQGSGDAGAQDDEDEDEDEDEDGDEDDGRIKSIEELMREAQAD